jgi:hypothetical protein
MQQRLKSTLGALIAVAAAQAVALFIKIKADKGGLLDEAMELLTFLSPAFIVTEKLCGKKVQ